MIEVTELRKRFGPVLALNGMSFTVERGQVTGFVGPNGAGKSTTMRFILGLDAPDAGTATGPNTLAVTGARPDQVTALLSRNAVHFSEVSAHRATLEDPYMDLTRDAVELRAGLSEQVR